MLDRHVKYSDLHSKSLKKIDVDLAQKLAEKEESLKSPKSKVLPKAEEGKDYKLLYYGSKFFWKTQDNVDISLFQHILCDVIEVVPFDVYKNKELDRIYLHMPPILLATNGDVESKIIQKKGVAAKDKFTRQSFKNNNLAVPVIDPEVEDFKRICASTFILNRLTLSSVVTNKTLTVPTNTMSYVPLPGDAATLDPVLPSPPSVLIPCSVIHRRNTSTEEITQKFNDLALDQAALAAATRFVCSFCFVCKCPTLFSRTDLAHPLFFYYSIVKLKKSQAIFILSLHTTDKLQRECFCTANHVSCGSEPLKKSCKFLVWRGQKLICCFWSSRNYRLLHRAEEDPSLEPKIYKFGLFLFF